MMINLSALTAATLAAVLFFASFSAYSQVEVVDLDVPSTRMGDGAASKPNSRFAKPSPASMTEFYFQLQALQEEVQTLRGLVEQQGFEIKKLKQEQLDNYLDLDRRLSNMQSSAQKPAARLPASVPAISPMTAPLTAPLKTTRTTSDGPEKPDELQTYRAGIDAVLKQRDYDRGIEQFDRYLAAYPQGLYAPNAKYWLGQIYMQRKSYSDAKKWFAELIAEYPAHQKTPEAQFKLGKVLHLQGDTAAAKQQLQQVASSGSSAAKLAQDYLADNF